MRLAVVSPLKARSEFLKALDNAYGVFEYATELASVSTGSGYSNPLGELNRVWNETYMNASIESIMNGYGDPRREFYFEHCTATDLKGEYRGIRQGFCPQSLQHFVEADGRSVYRCGFDDCRRGVVSSCGGGIAGLDIRGCGRML